MTEETLFDQARALPEAERVAFLERECPDADLRARVLALLAADAASNSPLDQVPEGTAAHTPINDASTDYQAMTGVAGAIIAGRYKLLQQIGEGGMGTVWMAEQLEPVKRKVAVKLIRAEKGSSQTILARFEAERQAIALMDHPHIARLLDAGTTDTGAPFFVMELVKGIALNEYCDAHKLTIPERLNLFMQICGAVQHAHQKGIIHRDLKPSNILVESHDGKPVPKVIDFGLAKATTGLQLTEQSLFTGFGTVMGTPLYMAPEQATFNAIDVDTRADIYALGVVLYELLTGTTPITRDTFKKAALEEVLRLVREQEPMTPSSRLSSAESAPSVAANRQTEPGKLGRFVKGELDWIVMRALAKDRDRRYETANGFARDIERFLNHEPVQAGPPTAWYRLQKFVRRNRATVTATALVAGALVVGVIGTTLGLLEARRQAEIADQQRTAALAAAEQEREATQEAMRRLTYARKSNEILGSVFAGLDPEKIAKSGRPLQDVLKDNLYSAVRELDKSAIGEPLEVAGMQNTLGLSLLGLGEAKLAIVLFEQALTKRLRTIGGHDRNGIKIINNLANAYKSAGDSKKALAILEKTFEIMRVNVEMDDPTSLICMSSLADTYRDMGMLDKALPLLQETLKLTTAKLGPDDDQTLIAMNNLAVAYNTAGKTDKALLLYQETWKLVGAKLGPNHPKTLIIMNNIASAYTKLGKAEEALILLKESLKISQAQLGRDHPSTLINMNNLAECYRIAGQLDKSLPLLEDALRLMRDKLGHDHPDTLVCLNNLATGYAAKGDLGRGLPLLEETLRLLTAKLGHDHLETLTCLNNLAMGYRVAGRWDKALPRFEEALRLMRAKLPLGHPNTLGCMHNLGVAYCKAKQGDKAVPLLKEFLASHRKQLPTDAPRLAALLVQVSLELLQCDQFPTAEEMLREALAIREKKEPEAWTTFNTQSLLGEALLGLARSANKGADKESLARAAGYFKEAELRLVKGYEGMKAREKTIPPQGAVRLPEALDRLIALYEALKKPDEVKKYRDLRATYPAAKEPKPKP